jgi:membrane protein
MTGLKSLRKMALLLVRAGDDLVTHGGVELAGYLTFLAILSLFPFLVILVALAGFIGQGELGADFINLLITHLPQDVMESLRPRIDEIISGPPQGLLTVSILGALWTSSSAVDGIRTALNRAYKVHKPPTYWLRRLVSILQVLLLIGLIMVFMLGTVVMPILLGWFAEMTGMDASIQAEHFFKREFVYVGAMLVCLGVMSLYYMLPNLKQSLVATLPGAVLTVALWILGAKAITYYLAHLSQVNLIYGSLSGFIATLVFFYVMNLIFIFGAECNHQILQWLHIKHQEREQSDIDA